MKRIEILLVGIGGYGNVYVDALTNNQKINNTSFCIAGYVDPFPEKCNNLALLIKSGVSRYESIDEYFQKGNVADLAVITTPIHYHYPMTCSALEYGCSAVLCAKPVAGSIQEAYQMIKTRDQCHGIVSIGYQWSFSPVIQALKMDILEGLFGKAIRLKTIALWPRNKEYYERSWAGKCKSEYGDWILDSVANNATAHYIHNMLFVLGETMNKSAVPVMIRAELYKINNIDCYDTAAFKIITSQGVELFYYGSHAVKENYGPIFSYEFEKGTVEYRHNGLITASFRNGTTIVYGSPDNADMNDLSHTIDCIRSKKQPICGIETAMSHTVCVNGAHESACGIYTFPESIKRYDYSRKLAWVEGLKEIMLHCYTNTLMPTDAGYSWAYPGRDINLKDYTHFPMGDFVASSK